MKEIGGIMNSTDGTNTKTSKPTRLLGRRIIKARFQLKFSLVVFGLMCVFILLIWWMGHRLVAHMVESGLIGKPESATHLSLLASVITRSSILSWLFVFGATVFFSHLIAGPVYRFEKTLKEIKTGDLSMRVRIRPHDELQELAQDFDSAVASLREKVKAEQAALAAWGQQLEDLAHQMETKGHAEEARRLRQIISDIRQHPSPFKV
jgi:methyl-accepting chemotaxis protein